MLRTDDNSFLQHAKHVAEKHEFAETDVDG